jgi:magnesium transporter
MGTVALDRILRTKRPILISDIMGADVRTVEAEDDQEEVARAFERYDLVSEGGDRSRRPSGRGDHGR